ncbi:Ribokinase [Rubripirellula lacrimiformis]|uniref:Ribokinase n=1 Tax=Rubripirellula lacrimiformis TaxID=1930273 RepID=A0A517N532_9BACT|nr:ribokinase [Rubripirellula lacrimiformis]QDT02250.1 Ribokinase [Rubripirellula lacrimiformis]
MMPSSDGGGAQDRRPKIVVLGSINMDLVIRCKHLSLPGQTVIADSCDEVPGGKGANQAVAAARAGGNVAMIGRIGDDGFADRLLANLGQDNIDTQSVIATANSPSGIAIVAVESSGENSIMVVPGANAALSPQDVQTHRQRIASADILLVQLEVPPLTVLAAMKIACDAGVRIVLDPAPMPPELADGLLSADVICPNQSEAAAIVGHAVDSVDDARRAARRLHELGAKNVILTLADQGALVSDGSDQQWIPPTIVSAVDTTAAGDAFAGALAVRLAEGASTVDAARFASVAGAIAATRHGAQPGLPHRTEIEQTLAQSQP